MKRPNPIILVLAFLAPIFVAGAIASFKKHSELATEFSRQSAHLADIFEERAILKKNIDYFSLKTNIEREARSRLGLTREGEVTVILLSPKPSPSPTPSPVPPAPFYVRILNWIKSRD